MSGSLPHGGDLLILLLDVPLLLEGPATQTTAGGAQNRATSNGADEASTSLLEQLLYFVSVYLMVSQSNMLAVFGLMQSACEVLYLSDGLSPGGQGSGAGSPSQAIHQALTDMLQRHHRGQHSEHTHASQAGAQSSQQRTLVLSAGLSRALCLTHRLQASMDGAGMPLAAASAAGGPSADPTAHPHAAAAAPARMRPRVLCVLAAADARLQYIATMNAIFSAQRADVAIDTLMLAATNSTYLQQAAHLTGGLYMQVPPTGGAPPRSVLQHLLSCMAVDRGTRALLAMHQPLGVDFRASCFCHKRPVDVGHVCSVCLSIFCAPRRECTTCGAQFQEQQNKAQ